jgi:hypothetical protein
LPTTLSAVHASTSSARTDIFAGVSSCPLALSLSKGERVWIILT